MTLPDHIRNEQACTDYVATAPTPEMVQERLIYWQHQQATAEKFLEVATEQVGRLTLMLANEPLEGL